MIRLLAPMSLRTKLVLASVVVEVCMLTLLVGNSLRLMQDRLLDQARVRTTELNVLLNAAVAAPLAQRDYATLADLLEQSRRDRGIEYLALQERAGGPVVVAAGWERGRPLPAGKAEISVDDIVPGSRLELYVPIELAGQTLGRLYYGISTEFLASARSHLLRQSLLIAGAEVVLSIVLLALVGLWLTRSLGELSRAGARCRGWQFRSALGAAVARRGGHAGAGLQRHGRAHPGRSPEPAKRECRSLGEEPAAECRGDPAARGRAAPGRTRRTVAAALRAGARGDLPVPDVCRRPFVLPVRERRHPRHLRGYARAGTGRRHPGVRTSAPGRLRRGRPVDTAILHGADSMAPRVPV
ncbi:MAG: hypothetical protein MZV65_30855 [Chromatiales bacterium]|nr:hypothetical protein [Chromatiales bacterium]